MSDRQYQEDWKRDIYTAWGNGYTNVMGVMPTGGGKSHTLGEIVKEHQGVVAVIAHRQELVGQLSIAIARQGVRHRIIAPASVEKFIMTEHLRELGTNMVDGNAQVAVIGVDTLMSRSKKYSVWLSQVTLWVLDEAHHLLASNKWGKAVDMMPLAIGLGVTATPCRADGKGLGRHASGLIDVMIESISMRELIEQGYLTDYRIFAPPSDVNYEAVNITAGGDYNQKKLKTAVQESHLIGDVVQHYLRIAPGKRGITFATDVQTSGDIAAKFNAAGIPAMAVSGKTPDRQRSQIIQRFRNGEILQLVNCDLFGEGFDLPAIEVVSMARRTMSYSLYSQQFGRSLRPMPGKSNAIIIDHAGNVKLHGLPDKDRDWTLDNRPGTPKTKDLDDEVPIKYCVECTQPYARTNKSCPWCGHYPVPAGRSLPEHVDGDLHELDPAALAAMRGDVADVDADPTIKAYALQKAGWPDVVWRSHVKQGRLRQEMQSALRESMGWFAHTQEQKGRDQSESYRLFYHLFDIDVLSAQALGKPEAAKLATKINDYLGAA
tara:strand:- start:9180 stop:10817 length:1638 start_codon:yes stop_codon:yes gene_type:complete